MSKSGKARIPSPVEQAELFQLLKKQRYPEKNIAIMQLSFKLGLRVQEIAFLEIKEIARLSSFHKGLQREFTLNEIMALPAAYTKGADALKRSQSTYVRKSISFNTDAFAKVIRQVEKLAKAGADINPEDFYPPVKQHKGKSRDLPLVDEKLRQALTEYLVFRLEKDPHAKPSDPLFITQKGGSYSPNSLQQHMGKMLKGWAGIEKASSHSGRRALATDIIHNQKKPLSIAQEVLGHVNPATTIIYTQPTEEQIGDALAGAYTLNAKTKLST